MNYEIIRAKLEDSHEAIRYIFRNLNDYLDKKNAASVIPSNNSGQDEIFGIEEFSVYHYRNCTVRLHFSPTTKTKGALLNIAVFSNAKKKRKKKAQEVLEELVANKDQSLIEPFETTINGQYLLPFSGGVWYKHL